MQATVIDLFSNAEEIIASLKPGEILHIDFRNQKELEAIVFAFFKWQRGLK